MFFVYLSLGILLVLALHGLLKFLSTASPKRIHRVGRMAFYAVILLAVFFLLRFGLIHLAAIVSLVSVCLPIMDRISRAKARQPHNNPPSAPQPMDVKEARQILEVEENATPKDIRAAHRRMIQKNHPDQGGSEYLSSKINQARDVLLDACKRNKG